MNTNNPAYRLHQLLIDGKKLKINIKCRDAWRQLLDISSNDEAVLISRLGKVMDLPRQILNIIQDNFPDQYSVHTYWSTQINKAFMEQNLNAEWASFISKIDTHSLNYLKIASDLLAMLNIEQKFDQVKLEEIKKTIESIKEEVINADDIEKQLRDYIVRSLNVILIAIDEYNICGIVPVVEGIEKMIGHACFDESYRNLLSFHDIGKKLISALSTVANIISVVQGLTQLPDAMRNLLALK